MKILYVCERPYNLYRTLLKAVNSDEKQDILITETTEGMGTMYNELKNSNLFNNVFYYNEYRHNEFTYILKTRNTLAVKKVSDIKYVFFAIFYMIRGFFDYLTSQRKAKKITLPEGLDIETYDEIHITDSTTIINFYLYHRKSKNLIYVEHAKNSLSGEYTKLLNVLVILAKLRIIHGIRGSNRYIKAIEVNENKNLTSDTKGKEIREVPFDNLVSDLTTQQGEFIYQLYAKSYKFDFQETSVVDMFLTTTINGENRKGVHFALCEEVIAEFMSDADSIIIKPHPKDMEDYTSLIEKDKRCIIIPSCVSAEIFTQSTSLKIRKLIHIDSSSADCFKSTKEIITLGYDYIFEKGLITEEQLLNF